MKRGFSRREAATYIGRSYSWLAKKAMRGTEDPGNPGPRFIRVGRTGVLYLKEDLDAWLERWSGVDDECPEFPPLSETGVAEVARDAA